MDQIPYTVKYIDTERTARFGPWLAAVILTLGFSALASIAGCGGVSASSVSPEGKHEPAAAERAAVAATNSYLEAAVVDLMGQDFPILPLAGPGTCPGHFDLRPSQIERLSACRLLVRFDFQTRIEKKLTVRLGDSLGVAAIENKGGMCEPSNYADACGQIADSLVAAGLVERPAANSRLAAIRRRMEGLQQWSVAQIDAAGLRGLPVVTSSHQEAFCKGLGLNVVATYPGGGVRPSQLDEAVAAAQSGQAKLLIANLPEGRRTADMLAERLGVAVVVFANFPTSANPEAFDELVRGNVAEVTATDKPIP